MDFRGLCKENKVFDLFYRLFVWGGLGFFLYWLSSKTNGFGGEYISKAVATPPPPEFSQVIGSIGIIAAAIALLIKEISLRLNQHGNSTHLVHGIPYCLGKLSSDLILAPYNIMSFVLGWGIFLYSTNSFTLEQMSLAGILLVPYIAIMTFLAFVSLIVRTENGEWIYGKLYTYPLKVRVVTFIGLGAVMALFLWLHK